MLVGRGLRGWNSTRGVFREGKEGGECGLLVVKGEVEEWGGIGEGLVRGDFGG